jgi:mRNA interferase MazF
MILRRGDLCIANLNPVRGSEQSGIRPVIIFQNNQLNRFTSTVIIIPLTTNLRRAELPTCVTISAEENEINETSVALCHQIRAIDTSRIIKRISQISELTLFELEATVLLTLGYE